MAVAPPEIITVKGGTRLKIFRQGESEMLMPGAWVSEGDTLMLHYVALKGAVYGVILSVDGRGRISRHFPTEEHGSSRLHQGSEQALHHAFELDDAPRFERFFFLTSRHPVDLEAARAALERLGGRDETATPRLPAGVVLKYELLLRKRRPTQVTP